MKEHVAYVHIKDGVYEKDTGKTRFTYPGEGDGDVKRIVADLLAQGYDGGFSIEPHMAVVHHDSKIKSPEEIRFETYVEYGRRMEKIIGQCRKPVKNK